MPKEKAAKKKLMLEQEQLPDTDYVWGEALDAAFFTALTTRLTTPIHLLPAFRMGLVGRSGQILREPRTREERRALTLIDQIALWMRRSMAGRIPQIMNMYRQKRMSPPFIQAAARATSLRFNKYYDTRKIFYERPFPHAITGGMGTPSTMPGKHLE